MDHGIAVNSCAHFAHRRLAKVAQQDGSNHERPMHAAKLQMHATKTSAGVLNPDHNERTIASQSIRVRTSHTEGPRKRGINLHQRSALLRHNSCREFLATSFQPTLYSTPNSYPIASGIVQTDSSCVRTGNRVGKGPNMKLANASLSLSGRFTSLATQLPSS